jgi:hypothetical protein
MKVIADNPLHANLVWKVRYAFHKHDDPHIEYMLVNVGVEAKRLYMRANNMNEIEFEREITHMEVLPGLYIEGKDAYRLARVFIETLDYKVPSILKDAFMDNQIVTHSEFYAKLNLLLDHINDE